MKKKIGLLPLAALLTFLTLWSPFGLLYAKNDRKEVSRIYLTVSVPVVPVPTGACSGTFAHCVILTTWNAPTTYVSGGAFPAGSTLTYDVYRSTTSGTGYAKITTTPISAPPFEDDTVVGGTTYYYVLIAYLTVGTNAPVASAYSGQVSVTGLPIPIPNPPTGLVGVSY